MTFSIENKAAYESPAMDVVRLTDDTIVTSGPTGPAGWTGDYQAVGGDGSLS